jgi:Tol biopolymer transport system component
MSSERGGSSGKPGTTTLDALASARTVRSDAHLPDVPSAPALDAAAVGAPPTVEQVVLGDRYRLIDELGRGGEGVVYRAHDLKADAEVALKLLPHDDSSEVRLLRFRRELQMARKVTHPNVVRIHDLVELPGRFGLSMELVDGESLERRIERGALPRDEVVALAMDLARALAAAHEAGVVHRDLKPSNVLLRARGGRAVVTDFGVSRALENDADGPRPMSDATPIQLTREGALIGTPLYMAPEQLEGRTDVGPTADVYAFGLVVWEAATGRPLQRGDTIGDLRRDQRDAPRRDLHDERPDLPRALCDAVGRALSFERSLRFADGAQLLAALELSTTTRSRSFRRGALTLVGGAGLLAVGVAAAFVGGAGHRAAPSPSAAAVALASAPTPFGFVPTAARRLTFGSCEELPSFTPDSRGLVYDGTVGRDSFIFLLPIAGGAPKQLTQVRGWDMAPRVSPAGDRVAFVRFEGSSFASFVAPLDGSEPPRRLGSAKMRPTWTPDGKGIWAGDGPTVVEYDARTGTALRTIVPKSVREPLAVVQTSDGRLVVLFEINGDVNHSTIGLLADDGDVRWIFEGARGVAWALSPDEKHVLTMRVPLGTEVEMVAIPLDGSPPVSLASTHIRPVGGVALSPDGRHVAWSTCEGYPRLSWVDAKGRLTPVFQQDDAEAGRIVPIPGGTEFAMTSERNGRPSIWIADASGARPEREIPAPDGLASDLAVSPDGTRYAMEGAHGLYVGALLGGEPPHPVTEQSLDSEIAFSADGKSLLFTRSDTAGTSRVMSVPVEGGQVTPLLEPGSDCAVASPRDGRIVYLAGRSTTAAVPTILDPRAGTRRPLSHEIGPGKYRSLAFSLDGRRVAMVTGPEDAVEVDVATGAILRRLSTGGPALHRVAYATGGMVVETSTWQGGLWVADVAPAKP